MNTSGSLDLTIAKSVAYLTKVGGGTIANMNELHLLADGAIALVDDKNTIIPANVAAANIVGVKSFRIYRGGTNGKASASGWIDRASVRRKVVGVAPVKRVIQLGKNTTGSMNYPSPLIAGSVASIVIVRKNDDPSNTFFTREVQQQTVKRYETTVRVGDTNAAITNRLIAKVNADANCWVTAAGIDDAGTNNGIAFTAKDFGFDFTVAGDDILISATRHAGTALNYGKGTYSQMKRLERNHNIRLGNGSEAQPFHAMTHSMTSIVDGMFTNMADTDTPLDLWHFDVIAENISGHAPMPINFNEIVVAFVNGSAVLTTFETMLGQLMLTPDASGGVTASV